MELIGSRAMTPAERQRRSRSMRALRRLREVQQNEPEEGTEPDLGEPAVYTFTDAELDELISERSLVKVVEEGLTAIRAELREGLHRIHEQLGDLNLRFAILRDPFMSNSVAGGRLWQRDEAKRKAAPVPAGAQGARRLP